MVDCQIIGSGHTFLRWHCTHSLPRHTLSNSSMAAATMEGSSVRMHSEIFACTARFRTVVWWAIMNILTSFSIEFRIGNNHFQLTNGSHLQNQLQFALITNATNRQSRVLVLASFLHFCFIMVNQIGVSSVHRYGVLYVFGCTPKESSV